MTSWRKRSGAWREHQAWRGVVVDVFIPQQRYGGECMSAFVRYRFEEEQRRAIYSGNKLRVEGWFLRVSKAIDRRCDRSGKQTRGRSNETEYKRRRVDFIVEKGRDRHKTRAPRWHQYGRKNIEDFREVQNVRNMDEQADIDKEKKQEELVRNGAHTTKGGTSMEEKKASDADDEGDISRSDDDLDSHFSREDASLQIHIPEEDMAWLHWSAVGKLKQPANILTVQGLLMNHGVKVLIRSINYLMVLLTFEDESEMKSMISAHKNLLENWFESVEPWEVSKVQNQMAVWVRMEEVPLELWHENFFSSIGNNLGKFLMIDESTKLKKSFEVARMQVLVTSKSCIPNLIAGKSLGIQFRIPVSVQSPAAGEENLIVVAESERKSNNNSDEVLIFEKRHIRQGKDYNGSFNRIGA